MSWNEIPTTRYFREQVVIKRPYLKLEWILQALRDKKTSELQEDGRLRLWTFVEAEKKFLRVVLLEDGRTVHNAFFDRDFKEKELDYEVPLLPRD